MANTVNSLNYANTFSDWVNTTNLTTIELNSLGKGTYSKDSGVLVLNGAEALRANGQVNIYNSLLSVIGTGSSVIIQNGLTVGGTTTLNGSVIYSQNTLTLGASVTSGQLSYININRGSSGANASIRWNEPNKYFDILDVNSSNYYRILTTNTITDSVTTISSTIAASATAVNTAYSAAFSAAAAAVNKVIGTSGSATPISGSISILGSNGVSVTATSNTLTISEPQDLRTSASPSFATIQSQGSNNFIAISNVPTSNATIYNYNGIASNTTSWAIGVNNNGGTFTYGGTGNFTASGLVSSYSDERLKTNIQTITGALDKVSQLRGVSFDKEGKHEIGVIAQEIQKILPEVVIEGPDEDKTLSVSYGNIVGLLIEAIKELKNEINTLKGNTNG